MSMRPSLRGDEELVLNMICVYPDFVFFPPLRRGASPFFPPLRRGTSPFFPPLRRGGQGGWPGEGGGHRFSPLAKGGGRGGGHAKGGLSRHAQSQGLPVLSSFKDLSPNHFQHPI